MSEDKKEVAKAFAIAGLTALVVGLVELGVDWMRKRIGLEEEKKE